MAPPQGNSMLKSLGSQILGRGQLDRDALLIELSHGEKEDIIAVFGKIEAAGEKAAECMLAEPVAKFMGHHDADVCEAAVQAMGSMGGAASRFSEDMAEYLLVHPNAKCRRAAIEALGKLGPGQSKSIRQAVAGRLSDSQASVRQAALQALASMRATSEAEHMKASLADPVPTVQAAALESLALLMMLSEEVESICPEESFASLLRELFENKSTRLSALTSAKHLGARVPPPVIPEIVASLADKDQNVRQAAASAIGEMAKVVADCSEWMQKLLSLLKSPAAGTRCAAACALGMMGASVRSSAAQVAELLGDSEEDSSGRAGQMGGGLRRPAAQHRRPQCAALVALGCLGDVSYVPTVASYVNDGNWEVRASAVEALARFGPAAQSQLSTLTAALHDSAFPVCANACLALGSIGDGEAVEGLCEKLLDQRHTVRWYAVSAIGQLGDKAAEHSHEVFKLLNDPVAQVRAEAALTLSKLGEMGQNYSGVIGGLLLDEDAEVRCAAAQALGSMQSQHGAAFADELMDRYHHDPTGAVRAAALQALQALGAETEALALTSTASVEDSLVEVEDRPRFDGMGSHYADIQERKKELQSEGKWIEGIL